MLSLVFVPSFFTVMDDLGKLMQRIFGRFIGPTDEPDDEANAAHGTTGITDHSGEQGHRPLPLAAE